jgi:hypothetical protein
VGGKELSQNPRTPWLAAHFDDEATACADVSTEFEIRFGEIGGLDGFPASQVLDDMTSAVTTTLEKADLSSPSSLAGASWRW